MKEKYSFVKIWKTRGIRSLFNLKDKVSHVSSVVYEGKCNCSENYIGETGRQDGMNIATEVKFQNQRSILINFLDIDLIGKFSEEFQIK